MSDKSILRPLKIQTRIQDSINREGGMSAEIQQSIQFSNSDQKVCIHLNKEVHQWFDSQMKVMEMILLYRIKTNAVV